MQATTTPKTEINATLQEDDLGNQLLNVTESDGRQLGLRMGLGLRIESPAGTREGIFLGWWHARGASVVFGEELLERLVKERVQFFATWHQMGERATFFYLGVTPFEGESKTVLPKGEVKVIVGPPVVEVGELTTPKKQKDGSLLARVLVASPQALSLSMDWGHLKKLGMSFETLKARLQVGEEVRELYLSTSATEQALEKARSKAKPSERPALVGTAHWHWDDRRKNFFLVTPLTGKTLGLTAKAGMEVVVRPA